MPKPKKDKEKKTSGAGGWDWSSFATEPSTPAKTTSQPQQPQNKGAGWDWSTLPTNQADETRRQQREREQRQAGQREAARYAAQDRVISAGRYAADAMRGGLRALGMGRDYTADDLEIQSDRYRRDYQRYTEMARDARQYRDADLLSMAQNGLRQSGYAYNNSYQRYLEAQKQANDKRNRELKETNKAQWYGENLSREQIEGQLRQLEQRKAENARSAELATEAAKNDPNRAAVYSSQVGDGREPWYTRALWNTNDRNDEIDAEIARYQAALRYRDSLDRDNEMAEMARSISSASNFRQMSEIGKDMVEKRNQSARASVNSTDYMPDDPDDNRQFAKAEQQEREALLAAGYVSDLDSSYIPEEVKPVYYALFAQSPAKAKAFAEYWAEKGEQAYWNEIYEKSGEDAGTRARAFIEGTFANTVAGLAPFEEGGQYAAKLGRTMIGGGAAGLTEKGLFNTGFGAGTYHSDLFGDISLGSAYQLGSSMLQSAANATLAKMTGGAAGLVGGAGIILLGSSAAAQDYQEKIEQGWDESSAKLHALAAGAAESVFEYVSLDKLIDQDITRGFLRNILTQGGVEASEEALTTISNRITDAVISEATGNENQIETKTRELVEKGYELGTAEKMAQQEWLTELMSDALGGFVSGGLMSSGQYAMYPVYKAIGAVQTNRYNERTGALSSRTGEAAALAQYAADNNLEWASPEQSAEPVKSGADSTKTNLNESTLGQQVAEAAEKNKSRQELRQERKANRQTGADVNRARSHIQKQLAGKTVQEQQTVRDELIQKYGEAIAPTVSRAITMETAKQAAQMDSTDAIRKAREAALAEISDEDMKRDVADGYDQAAYAKINQSGSSYEADRYIQQLRTTGTGNMSMEATVEAQDGQSRKIAITGMTEDGKGVKLADGTTVAVSKLQADADTMDVIQQMADLDMGQDADEVFQAYQRSGVAGTEGYRWLMNYATAYNQGRVNSVSLEEAVARSSLDDRTVLEAYTLGQRSAHRETQQGLERLEKLPKKKGVTGKTSKINTDEIKGETMNDSERQQFDYANRIVSALGINLTWFSSKADAKGRIVGKNGAYENGTIYMDIHAGRNFESDLYSGILATMSHELSHFQQQYAPREYQALKQFLFRQIAQNSKGGEDALERLIWEKQRRSGNKLSRRQAEDEVVADACQKMIRDSKAIHEFAREHESAVAGMVRWLKDWFKKLRAIFNRSSATFSREAELMDKLEADVRKTFGELWDKGITEAVRVHDQVGSLDGESQGQNSERDTEYLELAKDPEKNQERLQEMVDEAALAWGARTEDGKPKAFYHSTNAKFTIFKKGHGMLGEGIYFSTYGQNFYGKNQIKAYLKYENPINFRDVPLEGKERSSAGIPMGIVDNFYDMFPEYDAIISRDEELTVKSPSQIKSADPVAYDDAGNVIPLSERFNTKNPDIRFSERTRLEGQMGLFGDQDGGEQAGLSGQDTKPQSGTQTSMFGTTERAAKAQKPKAPTPGELFVRAFDDFLRAKKAIRGGKWYGNEFDEFFRQNPKMDFVSRFMADDQRVRQDMRDFLATIDDMEKLDGLSWYTTQSPSVSRKAGYRSALTKVRNEYKRRINEIAAQKAGGHEIKLTRGKYSFEQVETLFRQLNSNEAVAKLADKVFPVAKELGLDFYATNRIFGEQKSKVKGSNFGKDVFLKINAFADKALTDQYKASVILHEMIHACTVYALSDFYDWRGNTRDSLTDGIQQLYTIYGQARGEKSLAGTYGMTNIREFVAELAQPEFREKLEKVSLLERVLDAIKRFFGIEKVKGSSYLDSASAALDYLIDEIDRDALREYYEDSERQAKAWERQKGMTRYSERDYSLPSDQELMNNAAEHLSEAGGEEYWKALLESAPELAGDREELRELMKANRAAARKLAETEAKLEEARRQMKPGGNRKLNTRGIVTVTQNIMKDLHAGDAKNRGVAKGVTQILTDAYQKGLDAIDADKDPGEVWDIVFNEGVMKATDYLLQNATYAEKHGRGWITSSLGAYMPGEDGRFAVMDAVSARVVMDWGENRVREAMQATIADRLIERTENRMQKQIDAATERATTAEQANKKMSEDLDFWKTAQDKAAKQVTFLDERLKEARDDLKTNRSASAKERKAAAAKAEALANRLTSKRREAAAWKRLAEQNESLLRAALRSKNADLEAQSKRAETAEARLASETVNARAWERNADLYAKQLDKEMAQKAKIVKQLEAQVEREKKILAGTLKPPAMQRLLKAARDQATKDANKHKDEAFQKYKERQTQSRLRSRIKNLADDMKRKMTNPSERSYVPASLYSSMTLLCDALDDLLAPNDGTKAAARYRAVMDRIHGLSAEYQAVKNLDDPTFSSEYDEEIQYEINEIIRTLQGYDEEGNPTKFFTKVRELTTGELQKVYDIMKYINYCMTTAKDLMGSSQYKTVFDAMRAVADQQRSLPQLLDVNGVKRWNRSRLLDNLSVMRAVEMMSGWDRDAALYQLMHNIEQGTDASWAWVMDYNKSQQALKTGKNEREYREALTKKLDYGVTDEEGRKVLMTKLQALQILMTAEREAHNDKLLHLQAGGAKIRDAIDLQNGKGAQARSQTIQVTPELIQRIQESVTDWDRAYMKNVRDYFRKEGKRTNEILYKLKHRVLQTEDYYVPYKVDDNYLETKLTEQQAMNMWVNTPGSTNALKQKAKQPVIIDGMDTVMGHHVKEMGDYIGLAIPIRDFSKVYNGRLPTGNDNPLPVKKTIDDTFGKKGQHLLTQAVIDVQGGSGGQNWRSGISDFLNKLQGAFVRSALLINPSVTIKQAASYIAAESVLSHRALVAGNRATFASTDKTKSPALIAYLFANPEGKTAQRIYNEIDEHTSLHYQRRQGMSQAEIANEANRNGRVKRWMNGVGARMEQNRIGHAVRKAGENLNPVTWIQRMDVATTATLWVACKEQAKMDGMKAGTAEFWQRTTELYERVIRETQPMYDGLHRTAHQKQAGTLTQYLFPFRTVPIQNHGQLAASYEALKASKNKSKAQQAEARKFFAKTVWAQAESAFIFSLMTFIAAALKRKTKKYRDEDEELSAGSVGMGLGKDVLSTLFSVLQPMYGSELVSLGSRALDKFDGSSGYTYDAFSVGVVDMINDMASAGDKLLADAGKLHRGENVSLSDVGSHGLALLMKAAKLAGIPADTIKTYYEGLLGNVEDALNGRIPAMNDESWERSAAVNAERYLKAWIAGDLDKVDSVEAEMLGNYTEAGKSEEKANEAMKAKMTATAKAAWESGRLDEQDAIDFLTETGYYDEDEAWKTVQRWEGNAAHKGEEDYTYSQYEDLNDDLSAGKNFAEAAADYLEHGYKEEDLRENAVKNAKKRYQAGDLTEDEAIDLLLDYAWKKENGQYRNLTKDEAWMKVKEWRESADYTEEDGSWGQYDAIDEALAGNKDIKALVSELTAHGVEEKNITQHVKGYLVDRYVAGQTNETQLKNQLSRYLGIVVKADVDKILKDANSKKLYGVEYGKLDEEYRAGKIGKAEIKKALMQQGGMSSADADLKIRWYDLQKANPKLDISEAVCNAWYDGTTNGSQKYGRESARSAGMSIERYVEARKYLDTIKDSNGNGTGEDEVIRALAGMSGLTSREKDALYYERYKGGARKGIYKTW